MRKLLLSLTLFFSVSLCAFDESGKEFELRVGPRFSIKNSVTQISTGFAIGGEYVKFLFDYSYGGSTNFIRPALLVDVPFYLGIGDSLTLGLGPTFDIGPAFGFSGGATAIFFAPVGLGMKTLFFFNDNIGIGFTPVHFTMSFASAIIAGGSSGVVTVTQVSYDLMFSFVLRW
ncbi:MAG: hypothetical protein JXA66_04070 [Oligoflexia bacterium]|nr:hypothetical protein [Oligoflexia bacterium]